MARADGVLDLLVENRDIVRAHQVAQTPEPFRQRGGIGTENAREIAAAMQIAW